MISLQAPVPGLHHACCHIFLTLALYIQAAFPMLQPVPVASCQRTLHFLLINLPFGSRNPFADLASVPVVNVLLELVPLWAVGARSHCAKRLPLLRTSLDSLFPQECLLCKCTMGHLGWASITQDHRAPEASLPLGPHLACHTLDPHPWVCHPEDLISGRPWVSGCLQEAVCVLFYRSYTLR